MTDVLKQLPVLSWRGIEVPITARSISFSQTQAKQKFSYRDNSYIESLGADNIGFSYTIPFRQDIAKGPYVDLFVDVLPRFLEACRRNTAGDLNDPVLGIFRAKCTNFSSTLSPDRRDGVDVEVSFIQAPEIDAVEALPSSIQGISELDDQAGALDDQVALADFTQTAVDSLTGELQLRAETEIETLLAGIQSSSINLGPPDAFQDLFGQIDGFGRQVERFGNKISAKLDQASFKLEKMERTISVLGNPKNWPLQRSSRRLRGNIESVKKTLSNPGKSVLSYTVKFAQGIADIAAKLGMAVNDFVKLNPTLARRISVQAGTVVKYLATEENQ